MLMECMLGYLLENRKTKNNTLEERYDILFGTVSIYTLHLQYYL